jgi:hypothetical protein
MCTSAGFEGALMSVLGQLYRLQEIDAEADEKAGRLAEVEAALGETPELIQAREAVVEVQGRQAAMHKQMRELELEIGGLDVRLQTNQERLYGGKVKNPKELASLQEEAASLRRHRSQLEDRDLELMLAVEEAEALLVQRQAALRRAEEAWQADQAGLLADRERLQARLAELDDMRAGMRGQLSRADLALYDDLRRRLGSNCIALLRSGICQVCGVDVPMNMARAVERSQGLNYCPICSHLLYAGG